MLWRFLAKGFSLFSYLNWREIYNIACDRARENFFFITINKGDLEDLCSGCGYCEAASAGFKAKTLPSQFITIHLYEICIEEGQDLLPERNK